jgi:hypothetical protein
VLTNAVASGSSVAEAAPVTRAGVEPPETRTLHSDVIRLIMRAGGQEIEQLLTDGAATLDFTPNRPQQAKRSLTGDRIWIDYGPANRIQSFRSVNVSTRTERPPQPGRPPSQPVTTQSKEILATFDPATSQLQPAGVSKFSQRRQSGAASFCPCSIHVPASGPACKARTCARAGS